MVSRRRHVSVLRLADSVRLVPEQAKQVHKTGMPSVRAVRRMPDGRIRITVRSVVQLQLLAAIHHLFRGRVACGYVYDKSKKTL